MSKELRDFLVGLAVYNLSVAAIIYVSMAFFVLGLEYDYTTSSSILFTIVLAFLSLIVVVYIGDELGNQRPIELLEAGFLLAFVLLAMGAVTASLGIFTAFNPQEPTEVYDMVSTFWGVLGWPFVQIGVLLGKVSPALEALFKAIGGFYKEVIQPIEKDSPIFSNTVSGLISGTLSALVSVLLYRGRQVSAPAG
jgi:hypothetical protein